MLIMGQERTSQIALCLKAARLLLMSDAEAILLATNQVKTIKHRWSSVCDEANLSEVDRNFLWRRQFLNPFAFLEAPKALTKLLTRNHLNRASYSRRYSCWRGEGPREEACVISAVGCEPYMRE
jgi:hypothetical protein